MSTATAQVFVPVPNARIIKPDPVDPTQGWLGVDNALQKGKVPTAASGWAPTETYQLIGRPDPGCLAITPDEKYAVVGLTNLDGSLAANTLAVVNLSTHGVVYSNPQVTSADGSITITFSGGGCAALPNGNVLLGNALENAGAGGAALMMAKLAILYPPSDAISYYDTTTTQAVYSLYALQGSTKVGVSYKDYTSGAYYVKVVDTANITAPVNFIQTSFPITGPPAFANGTVFLSGGGTVGAIVNLNTMNVVQTSHGFGLYMQSAGDNTYAYVIASNEFDTIDTSTGEDIQAYIPNVTDCDGPTCTGSNNVITINVGQGGGFTGMLVTRDPVLNVNHIVMVASKGLVLLDQIRPASAIDAVVDPFSYQTGATTSTTIGTIAANKWVIAYGRELSPSATFATSVPLPTSLGGTTATAQCSGYNPVPLATNYFGISQLNLLMPPTLPPGCTVVTLVTTKTFADGTTVSSPPVQLQVAESALGELQDLTSGNVWVVHPLNNNAVDHQAVLGEVITLYADGGGATQPCLVGSTILQCVTATPSITVGGMPADILFFGLQPTYAGLYQINLRVPANAPVGTQLLSVTMGSITTSSTKITITNGP